MSLSDKSNSNYDVGGGEVENFLYYEEDVKQAVAELKDEIGKTLEEGIKRNGILPRDWAMDRINDVIDEIFGDKLSQAVGK